jgi:hypothetical protein
MVYTSLNSYVSIQKYFLYVNCLYSFCLHVFYYNLWSNPILLLYQYHIHFQIWNCLSLVCVTTISILLLSCWDQEIWLEEGIQVVSLDSIWLTFVSLCLIYNDALSSTKNICIILSSYLLSTLLFIKSKNCFPAVFFLY